MFSKKGAKIDKIFTVDLMVTTYCQIDREDFVNFCGLLRKRELYGFPLKYQKSFVRLHKIKRKDLQLFILIFILE